MTATLDDIRETFDLLGDDWDERYRYIIELGRDLPPMDEADKNDATKVRGCASQVWMVMSLNNGQIQLVADSDAHIVRGLIAILLAAYQGRTPEEAKDFDIDALMAELQLSQALSPTRTNGLLSMIKRIQLLSEQAL
ncbi:MAG: SufE family protein [Sphingomonadales bacterium]|jgi:cysteine desulfuration protein SufE